MVACCAAAASSLRTGGIRSLDPPAFTDGLNPHGVFCGAPPLACINLRGVTVAAKRTLAFDSSNDGAAAAAAAAAAPAPASAVAQEALLKNDEAAAAAVAGTHEKGAPTDDAGGGAPNVRQRKSAGK